MLQKSQSRTIAKARYLIVIPIILVMLTIVACSDSLMPSSDLNLKKYNYTLRVGEEKSSENDAKIYEAFLNDNPDYVGWRIVDHEKETVEYSVHSKNEEVPADYKGYDYLLSNGEKTIRYVKEIGIQANTGVYEIDNGKMKGLADIPFAVVENVPVFPGCEDLPGNDERKKCMSDKVSEYVARNFNTGLGKELKLKGINRVIAVFKISSEGDITDVRARAAHPDLEAEAIRVISSLPQMIPGKHEGNNVAVSYSLPIVFQVAESENPKEGQ